VTFTKERQIHETNFSLAFWLLLPAHKNVKIKSDEQHANFVHELRSAMRLTVGFSNIYCEMYWIYYFCEKMGRFKHYIKIKTQLTVSGFSFFVPIDNPFVLVDSNSCISVTIQNWTGFHINVFFTMADPLTYKNIDLTSRITLYRHICKECQSLYTFRFHIGVVLHQPSHRSVIKKFSAPAPNWIQCYPQYFAVVSVTNCAQTYTAM
jgi:hypothetical protein